MHITYLMVCAAGHHQRNRCLWYHIHTHSRTPMKYTARAAAADKTTATATDGGKNITSSATNERAHARVWRGRERYIICPVKHSDIYIHCATSKPLITHVRTYTQTHTHTLNAHTNARERARIFYAHGRAPPSSGAAATGVPIYIIHSEPKKS